jgi:hypothetical protein
VSRIRTDGVDRNQRLPRQGPRGPAVFLKSVEGRIGQDTCLPASPGNGKAPSEADLGGINSGPLAVELGYSLARAAGFRFGKLAAADHSPGAAG